MPEQQNEIHSWGIPDVTTEEMIERESALGYRPEQPASAVEEDETLKPGMLTAADLEEIRQAAYLEGLEQGKEDGFAQGYQEGLAKGHEDGLAQGTAQGKQEGLTQGQHEIDALAEKWQALIASLHTPLRNLDDQVEQQLIQLTAQLAKAVVRTELSINTNVLLAGLREAVSILNVSEGAVRISLPPDDLQLIIDQYGEQGIAERDWHLLAEPGLQPGQLQVEHQISHVDIDLYERLEMTLQRFLAQLSAPTSQPEESATEQLQAIDAPQETVPDESQPED